MVDIVSRETRSRMMSGIRSKNTKPELLVRKGLHQLGFRFRLHDPKLPGKPDLVLAKHRAVIFVHGCFWHGHKCHLFKQPKSRPQFWLPKIESNRQRDAQANEALRKAGWRIAEIWECATKGKARLSQDSILEALSDWLVSERAFLSVAGE